MKTALITGASSGIGEVFANKLAAQNMNLVLVARSAEKLQQIAKRLVTQHRIHVHVIVADLSKETATAEILRQTNDQGLTIDMLVNNAGFATSGEFQQNTAQRDHEQIMVNISALVDLTHAFLPGMIEKKNGAIINVASTASFQPVPYMAVYGATKAFVLSFSEALWVENRKRGIHVMALCPGPTDTNFFNVAGDVSFGRFQTPDKVVDAALKALEKKKSFIIEGIGNTITAQLSRLFPRKTVALIAGSMMKPKNQRG